MFQFVTALFRRPARRRPAPPVRLRLDALEGREVPATIPLNWTVPLNWRAVGPQPEPPTRLVYTGSLLPVFNLAGHTNPEVRLSGIISPEILPVGQVDSNWKP